MKIVVLGLLKQETPLLADSLASLEQVAGRFSDWRGFVCAGRSAIVPLKPWIAALEGRVSLVPEPKLPKNRYQRMAVLRNALLDAYRASGYRADVVLMVDMDFGGFSCLQGVDKLSLTTDWAAVASLGLRQYAPHVRTHPGPVFNFGGEQYCYWDLLAFESLAGERHLWYHADTKLWFEHGRIPEGTPLLKTAPAINDKEWTQVSSAFGPACFYRAAALDGIRYDETSLQCEHHPFHAQLRQRGRIFVANDIVAHYDEMPPQPKYSISILSMFDVPKVKRCLESVLSHSPMDQIELILTNNGSREGVGAYFNSLRGRCRVKIIHNERNQYFIEPNRRALTLSSGRYFVMLNDDAEVPEGWLAALEKPFNDHATAALSGAANTPCSIGPNFNGQIGERKEYVEGSCLMARSDLVRRFGLFDRKLIGAYCEDVDLSLRMRERGYTVYHVPIQIKHDVSSTSRRVPEVQMFRTHNAAVMSARWSDYLERRTFAGVTPPSPPVVAIVYVFVQQEKYQPLTRRFVESYVRFPPGEKHRTVIVCQTGPPDDAAKKLFSPLQDVSYLVHDNSGQDIGAFQKAAREVPCDLMVFFGASTYFRKPGWMTRVVDSFKKHGPTLCGATGNRGDARCNVYPHIRTTAFWIPPALFNQYPHRVTKNDQRYPFEHGQHCLTGWISSHGMVPLVVSWQGEHAWEDWDSFPNGFHRGDHSNLLVGDRLCCPPYYHTP